jgi:hypothetical protein
MWDAAREPAMARFTLSQLFGKRLVREARFACGGLELAAIGSYGCGRPTRAFA